MSAFAFDTPARLEPMTLAREQSETFEMTILDEDGDPVAVADGANVTFELAGREYDRLTVGDGIAVADGNVATVTIDASRLPFPATFTVTYRWTDPNERSAVQELTVSP